MEYLDVLHDTEESLLGFSLANCAVSEPEIQKTISEVLPREGEIICRYTTI